MQNILLANVTWDLKYGQTQRYTNSQLRKYTNSQIHKYTKIHKYELERSIVHKSEVWASMDALEPPALTPPVITL